LVIPQLSIGDMLRATVSAGTSIGRKAKAVMERGELVPDELAVAVVAERIFRPDAREGFILDGFPRNMPQAMTLDDILRTNGLNLDCVVELKVDEEVLLGRILKRAEEAKTNGQTSHARAHSGNVARIPRAHAQADWRVFAIVTVDLQKACNLAH
jgi:adenylate kinase